MQLYGGWWDGHATKVHGLFLRGRGVCPHLGAPIRRQFVEISA